MKKNKERISIHDLEKMTNSKYVITIKNAEIRDKAFGDKVAKMTLDIFDGFAYCPDYEGKEYVMHFPKKKFVTMSKDMEKSIREYLIMEEKDVITETEIMRSYSSIFEN